MPATYRIDAEQRLIYTTATGVVTDDDMSSHQAALVADPSFDRTFDQIWDCREVEVLEVSAEGLRRLASARSFDADARRAVVAGTDVVYGMARMFQSLHDEAPEEVRVFRKLEEALAWLGVEAVEEPGSPV
ncbi:MAG: hypothetical protein QNK03_14015 [Myxococcota bacterium]|nr:hypothetical protein [Myxococcota bacterium]